MSKRFAINKTENTYNTISDFPTTGSGFGVNPENFTLYTGFVIPAYSRICFMNYGDSPDAALSAISPSGDIYSAFRNGGTWQNGKISASKSDLSSKAYATYYNGSDANTFAFGLYLVERCKNTPDESTWWLVISFVYPAAKAGAQIAYGLINKNFKRRSYVSGTWDSWENVVS